MQKVSAFLCAALRMADCEWLQLSNIVTDCGFPAEKVATKVECRALAGFSENVHNRRDCAHRIARKQLLEEMHRPPPPDQLPSDDHGTMIRIHYRSLNESGGQNVRGIAATDAIALRSVVRGGGG